MAVDFQSVGNAESLSERVEAEIEEAILSGRIEPGERLPTEHELCEMFGVSRTAVREGVRALRVKGLITVAKRRGMFVNELSEETVTDPLHAYLRTRYGREHMAELFEARRLIEPPVAAAAARDRTEDDVEKLERDLERMNACEGDFAELSQLDMQFHVDATKASGNTLMSTFLKPVHRFMNETMPSTYADIGPSIYADVQEAKDFAVTWHEEIMEAIRTQDPEAAEQAMDQHVKIAARHARRVLSEEEEGGD
jgi:GntR family transcriptional repressor for pyruvate dehydrogenase complex